jgi:hypothetical protein
MPPAGISRSAAASVAQFVDGLNAALATRERKAIAEHGREPLRRLNAYEYENAIRDLLGVA